MMNVTFVGSLDALATAPLGNLTPKTRICVLATAAAFRGPAQAIADVRTLKLWRGATVFGVDAIDRRSANDAAVLDEVSAADLVVLVEGAALHARSVWRGTSLGEVLAVSRLAVVGSVGSVLGTTMIDPRGGAPTTGLGLFDNVVLSVPAGPEQTQRTRDLLGAQHVLVELGSRAVVTFDGTWRAIVDEDLVVTRAGEPTKL